MRILNRVLQGQQKDVHKALAKFDEGVCGLLPRFLYKAVQETVNRTRIVLLFRPLESLPPVIFETVLAL